MTRMVRLQLRCVWWSVVLWCSAPCFGTNVQGNALRLDAISIEQGLSAASAQCIAQDKRGFLWVGTHDGLNRYDGASFTSYRHDARDAASLSVNNIWALLVDHTDTLWIGTRGGGLCRYERSRDGFTCYRREGPQGLSSDIILTLYEDRTRTFWAGTLGGGLCRYDRERDRFTCFQTQLPHQDVRALYEARDGTFWVGTQGGGLCRFDRAQGTCTTFRNLPGQPQSLSSNSILSITEDHAGTLWIGTLGGGLVRFDQPNNRFFTYRHDPRQPASLPGNTVIALHEDRFGEFWVGTLGNGLSRLDRTRGIFINQPGLLSNDVRAIYEDGQGLLWIGTSGGGGLHRLNRTQTGFVAYQHDPAQPRSLSANMIFSLGAEPSGVLWVGTLGGGLCRSDPDRAGFTCFQRGATVFAIHRDRAGELWFGTNQDGLCRFDRARERLECYRHDPRRADSLSSNVVMALAEDKTGALWVGTNGAGLCRFNRNKKSFACYRHDPNNPRSLSSDAIRVLRVDQKGTLWIGTSGAGLCRFDSEQTGFTRFRHNGAQANSLSSDDVRSLYDDQLGRLWIGTDGGGLNLFEPASQSFRTWRTNDGLPNDTICGIQEDAQGGLWLSTNQGLARFDVQAGRFRHYDQGDGLQSNEFTTGASCKGPDGELLFGGTRGFNSFFPERLSERSNAPPVILTGLRKFNQAVKLQPPIDELEELHLSHRDSVIGIEFAALDLAGAGRYRYRYRLMGFDPNWLEAGKQRLATYTNLDPGSYVFQVVATDREGVWPETGATLRVVVTPPFWRTWWFLLLAGSTVLGVVFMGYKLRVGQLEHTRQMQESFSHQLLASQERERQRIAAELHDSLGQRLIVIKNLALLLLQQRTDTGQAQQQVTQISDETSRAIHEVKEISYNLRPHQLEQVGLTKTLQGLVQQVAQASGIAITAELDPLDELFAPADQINVFRIVQEGLSNIVKHSDATAAQLIILGKDEHVELTLQDNGRGIANTERRMLSAELLPAGGFGLKGIAERVRMMKGTSTIESTPETGTKLRINLRWQHEPTE